MMKTLAVSAEVKDGERRFASYSHAGVDGIPDVDEVWDAELVVKVKAKFPFEGKQYRRGLKLSGYLHLEASLDTSVLTS